MLSRTATVRLLRRFAKSETAGLRVAAIKGLGRVRIRAAARALVELADGPNGDVARQELTSIAGKAEDDWQAWLDGPGCTLQEVD